MTTTTREPVPIVSATSLDPRVLAKQTEVVQKRLEGVWESARRALYNEPAVELLVAQLEQQAMIQQLDSRHFAPIAGQAVELWQNVISALDDAAHQHDVNVGALAAHEQALRALKTETNLHDAQYAIAAKEHASVLVIADADLRHVVIMIERLMPALTASVTRRVHAAAIVMRRIFVSDMTRMLNHARGQLTTVQGHRQMQSAQEEPMIALLDTMRATTGDALALPTVTWPTSVDVFAPPTLTE